MMRAKRGPKGLMERSLEIEKIDSKVKLSLETQCFASLESLNHNFGCSSKIPSTVYSTHPLQNLMGMQ